MQTFAASMPSALTRRAFLRLIVDPIRRAALALRNVFTSIGGSEIELLVHFFARPRFALG